MPRGSCSPPWRKPGGVVTTKRRAPRQFRRFLREFSGIVKFPKAGNLRTIATGIPGDRLLVETDSPYLAPVPHRGRRNQPAYVVEVTTHVAKLRGMAPEELGAVTGENFRRLFLRTPSEREP